MDMDMGHGAYGAIGNDGDGMLELRYHYLRAIHVCDQSRMEDVGRRRGWCDKR
jgi:hypothetical protein